MGVPPNTTFINNACRRNVATRRKCRMGSGPGRGSGSGVGIEKFMPVLGNGLLMRRGSGSPYESTIKGIEDSLKGKSVF